MRSDALRPPANPGLMPREPRYSHAGDELSCWLSSQLGLSHIQWEQMENTVPGGTMFFRGRQAGGYRLFVKAVPEESAAPHISTNDIAQWAAEHGAGALCLAARPAYSNGFALLLFPFCGGSLYQGNAKQRLLLARELGRLHRALAGFTVSQATVKKREDFHARLWGIRQALAADNIRAPYFPEAVRHIMVESAAPPACDTPPTLLHGDLNSGNVLFTDDKAFFLDFENTWLTHFPPERDLAYALERFLMLYGQASEENIGIFMRAYAENGGLISTISRPAILAQLRELRAFAISRLMGLTLEGIETPLSEWRKMVSLWHWLENAVDDSWWETPFDAAASSQSTGGGS